MTIENFKTKVNQQPQLIEFSETIAIIDSNYEFMPTAFKNGNTYNPKNQNNGSCKVFAFALHQKLSKEETLACFGQFYFKDVLENPEGTDHQNIRNFMQYGFDGLVFEGTALTLKS